jgi:hypothetical protein
MDNVIENDTFHMLLTNQNQKVNGEFDIEFEKPIEFKRNMECALIEMNISNNINSSRFNERSNNIIKLSVNFYLTEANKFDNIAKVDKLELLHDDKYFHFEPDTYTQKSLEKLFEKFNNEAKEFIDNKMTEIGNDKLMVKAGREVEITYPKIGFENEHIYLSAGGIKVKYEPLKLKTSGTMSELNNEWIFHTKENPFIMDSTQKQYVVAENKVTKFFHKYTFKNDEYFIDEVPFILKTDVNEKREYDWKNLRGYFSAWVPRAIFIFEIKNYMQQTFGLDQEILPTFDHLNPKRDYLNQFYPSDDYVELLRIRKATFKPLLNDTNDTFFIYCNIIKESHFGNQKVNILRVFPREKSDQHNVLYVFHNLIFIPLRVQTMNSITLSVRNQLGNIMNIKGDISALLIFRPIEYT